jgi:hypothetical protein
MILSILKTGLTGAMGVIPIIIFSECEVYALSIRQMAYALASRILLLCLPLRES